eukprot:TRINITY_DN8922_c0_g1_i3.p1 TRINITY_DN8922_c0_g1~~TRINITY_DN8922_c0_g1_i3.p1  ORF type:complete len:226 (-),score=62.43 TRINITY_DN8922_c0_g1_i3:62-682(-)
MCIRDRYMGMEQELANRKTEEGSALFFGIEEKKKDSHQKSESLGISSHKAYELKRSGTTNTVEERTTPVANISTSEALFAGQKKSNSLQHIEQPLQFSRQNSGGIPKNDDECAGLYSFPRLDDISSQPPDEQTPKHNKKDEKKKDMQNDSNPIFESSEKAEVYLNVEPPASLNKKSKKLLGFFERERPKGYPSSAIAKHFSTKGYK